ncbi:MAG: crotonase/enoyl-CoA hydratase family protein [Acidimicrobiia bacterium]|nr:crotonase/enoyl-CoA hydratase family protein [Acidimicrobiia bacterium]
MTDLLTYRLEGSIAVLALDDGKANVFNDTSIAAIHAALDRAEKEAGTVVLAGRPGRFSGGFDLSVMGSDIPTMQALVRSGAELLLRIWEFPRPFLIACTGHAVAAGAMFLLAADYRIGIEGDWTIGLNEVGIGMPLPVFTVELARARLDPRHFTKATLHAQLYDGAGAVEAGYLDEAVAPEALLDRVMAKATDMSKFADSGYGPSKHRVRSGLAEFVRAGLDEDMGSISPPVE